MTVPQTAQSWRKSTRSQNEGACVELAGNAVGIRDSKVPTGAVLTVPWPGLVAAVKTDRITR